MKKILSHLFLWVLLALLLFPLFWMFAMSLGHGESSSLTAIFSQAWSFRNYSDILSGDAFPRYIFNSFFVSIILTVSNCVLCLMVAYVFARKEFRFKKFWFATVLSVLILPAQVVMIPMYRLMVAFGWINTYWALIIPWLVTPFGVFMLKQFIEHIPRDMEDAARIDGANQLTILFRIVMPLTTPMLILLAVFEFLSSWNSFLFPFLFTNDESMRTLPVGLAFYLGKQSLDWGHLMAGASVAALPVIVLFIIFQRKIVAGLMAGALKQ